MHIPFNRSSPIFTYFLTSHINCALPFAMADFKIVERLGGRQAVFDRLKAAGHDLKSTNALRMWLVRGSIPGDAQVLLMRFAAADGLAFGANDFTLLDDPGARPCDTEPPA